MSTAADTPSTATTSFGVGLPNWALILIAAVLTGSLAAVAVVRIGGTEIREADAPAVKVRALRFEDRTDGSVDVIDHARGDVIANLSGEQGFLRGAMRAMARERIRAGGTRTQPFDLIARADGRLTLVDPVAGTRIDLESFGPTNSAVFARLLRD
jgi:putative photosynthetic complex assembly protein